MTKLAIPLENLLRRAAETPQVFLEKGLSNGAILNDLLWERGLPPLSDEEFTLVNTLESSETNRRLEIILRLFFWVAADPGLAQLPALREALTDLSTHPHLVKLAGLVAPDQFVRDPDRREELVRFLLLELQAVAPGETEQQARDRLLTLDSVERARVIEETKAAAERAQQLAEEMARREAEEAASKYSRE